MKTVVMGEWKVNVGDPRAIAEGPIAVLEGFLSREWREAFLVEVRHPWFGSRNGVPSPIVRIDMAPACAIDARASIYEVEARPAGLGVALTMLPEPYRKTWRDALDAAGCQGLVQIEGKSQDDPIAAALLGLPYADAIDERGEGVYWIRASEMIGMARELEDSSVTPIRDDGDKMHLVRLGMSEILQSAHEIDWSRPFAMKPLQGSRCEGVEIWLPKEMRGNHIHGSSKEARIMRTLGAVPGRTFITQPFIPPCAETIDGVKGGLIWRIFFGWEGARYRFIGGMWSWRPNLKNHGATDTVQGALLL